MPWNCHSTNIDNLWMLPAKRKRKAARSESSGVAQIVPSSCGSENQGEEIDTGLDSVEALKVSFDNILIDCGSLRDSTNAAVLANSVDGVVVVVDAGHSRNDEILNAQRTIEAAGGKFLGFVFE